MNDFEIKIVQWFNKLGGKKADEFLGFINSIRFLTFFWLILVILAAIKHPNIAQQFLVAVFVVAVLHFGITEGIIKHALTSVVGKRRRPYIAYPEVIKPIGKKFSDSSFPSSHMATTCAMAVVIAAFYPSLIIPAVILGTIMAFSRLHNGMHYPSDILVGTVLGIAYGMIAISFLGWIY